MEVVSLRAGIEQELHDISQPLMAVSCHLELGKMLGDADSINAAVDGALVECQRTFARIEQMRQHVNRLLDGMEEKL